MLSRAAFLFLAAMSPVAAGPSGWSRLPSLPDPAGVAAPFAGVSGGALVVAGGANFPGAMPWEGGKKVWHDTVRVLERPDGVWRDAGKLPRPLAYGVSLTVDGGLLCLGGSDAGRHYADGFLLTWREGKLITTAVPALPLPLAGAAGAVDARGAVYVAGGSTEPGELQASNRVFRLRGTGPEQSWEELPPLPGPALLLPVAAAHGGAFYVFGGAALEPRGGKMVRRYVTGAWRYRLADGWVRLRDVPQPCAAAASPAPVTGSGGAAAALLVAGDDGSLAGFTPPEKHPGFPGTIWRYAFDADAWSEAGKAPAPRATLSAVLWHGRFVFPSGEVRPGVRSPEVWAFDPGAGEGSRP